MTLPGERFGSQYNVIPQGFWYDRLEGEIEIPSLHHARIADSVNGVSTIGRIS